MNKSDVARINEEYYADRKAARDPLRPVGVTNLLDSKEVKNLGRRVIADATKAGVDDAELDAMKSRMTEWFRRCRAYQADKRDVIRDCKDARECRSIISQMRIDQDNSREEIFGE